LPIVQAAIRRVLPSAGATSPFITMVMAFASQTASAHPDGLSIRFDPTSCCILQ